MRDNLAGSPWQGRKLHFIGIGGVGMSGIAYIATQLGATVSGSDIALSTYGKQLKDSGVEVKVGHAAENLPADCEVVYSTAISQDNIEFQAAKAAGFALLHRSELLEQIAALKRCIAVTGTHGKTTTTAMITEILHGAGLSPSYVVGSDLKLTGRNAELGRGEWIIVEADESDRSLLNIVPEVAVVTNLELDHHTTYSSEAELWATVSDFANKAKLLVTLKVELPLKLADGELKQAKVSVTEFSANQEGGSNFQVSVEEGDQFTLELPTPGLHNAIDAALAAAVALNIGVSVDQIQAALSRYSGTGRRFELRGETESGAVIYDDYAHHPTEVAATLTAARSLRSQRLVAVFQPHLYSRTEALVDDFGSALALADVVVVLDIYPARERAEDYPDISGFAVAKAAADHAGGKPVLWLPTLDEAFDYLSHSLRDGDICLLLGAGNITDLGGKLCQ